MLTVYITILIAVKIIFTAILYSKNKFKNILITSYFYGVISLSYSFCVLPLNAYKETNTLLDFIFVLSVILFYSTSYVLYSCATFVKNKIKIKNNKMSKVSKILAFSFLVVVAELAISSLTSIFTSGSMLPDYTFTNIGFALSYSPLIFFAKYAHVYGLTFILCLAVGTVTEIFHNKKIKFLILIIFTLLCFTNINKNLDNYTQVAPKNMLIVGEGQFITKEKDVREIKKDYGLIIDSTQEIKSIENTAPVFYSASKVYNIQDNSTHKIYKRFRIPFGEYWPWAFNFIKYINPEIYNIMIRTRNYATKDDNEVFTFNNQRYAVLICSDAWSPISVKKIMEQNPDTIILQRSDDIFHSNQYFLAHLELWKRVLLTYTGVNIIDIAK